MQISVSGKHLSLGKALEEYVESELLERVVKYFEQAVSADVVFTKERYLFSVDIIVNEGTGNHMLIKAQARAENPHGAFDQAAEKISKQLRRYKRRIKDHQKLSLAEVFDKQQHDATKYVLSSEDAEADNTDGKNDSPLIIAEKATKIQCLTVSDAVMFMDLGDLPALMFINKKTNAINVVYRREDGNISWIDSPLTQESKDAA